MPTDIAHSPRITIAEALLRLELAVGHLEAVAAMAGHDREVLVPAGQTGDLEAARAEIEVLREAQAAVSEKLETVIARLRTMVAEEQ